MKNAKSQKMVVVILCVVVFGVVFYQFSWQARAATLSQAAVVRDLTAGKQADLAAATKAKEQETANRAALAAVQAVLPATADAQGVIRQLTQLAVSSGVNWQNVSLQKPAATTIAGLQAVPLSVSITGTMANIEAYLANIRGAAVGRIIIVDGVSTALSIDATTKSETVVATLTMRAFMYAIDPATITGTTAAAAGVTKTPAGAVPVAVSDPTNVDTTPTTAASKP